MPTMIPDSNPASPLSGELLDSYLDRAVEMLDASGEEDDDEQRLQAVADWLGRQPMQAENTAVLYRIYRLWLQVDQPRRALQAIEAHVQLPTQLEDARAQAEARIDVAFWRLHALRQLGDVAVLAGYVEREAAMLAALPMAFQPDKAWRYLAELAGETECWDVVRHTAQARHALQLANPQREHFRAWDAAVLAVRLGEACKSEGSQAQADEHARTAMVHLRDAAAGQDVDYRDWLNLAPSLQAISPRHGSAVIEAVRKLAPKDLSPPLQRDLAVRLARIQACLLHGEGQLAAALVHGWQGRVILSADENDDAFNSLFIDWLLEAGEHDSAAWLNFEAARAYRDTSGPRACERAHEQLARERPHACWALALCAGIDEAPQRWVEDGSEPEQAFQHYLALARTLQPGIAAADHLEGLRFAAQGDYVRALPLLESAMRDPALVTATQVEQLLYSRIRVCGVECGLEMALADAASAEWNYAAGVRLDQQVLDAIEDMALSSEQAQFARQRLGALAIRYYEIGLRQFEDFFTTGRGHLLDGDVHSYSKLCNNLGIGYRWISQTPERALPLHYKGLDASPFAEHYHSLLNCYQALGRHAEYIDTADKLWHFAADYGYSRHSPLDYVGDVCLQLLDAGRDAEIPFWMQRQEAWWHSLDTDEQEEHRDAHVSSLVRMLSFFAHRHPADAVLRLEALIPDIESLKSIYQHKMAGLTYLHAQAPQQAEAWFLKAVAVARPGKVYDDEQLGHVNTFLAKVRQQLRKPWWKFW